MGGAAELIVEFVLVLLGGRGGVHELHNYGGSPRQQEGAGEDGVKAAMVEGREEGVGGATKEGVGEAGVGAWSRC